MRGGISRNLSLIAGLILFAFAATHFLNHAVGLFRLDLMDEVQQWRLAVTRSWPGSIVLGMALLTHILFGLLKTARRGTLRLPAWERMQIVLGLTIPFLLLPHVVDTRLAMTAFGVQDSYLYEVARRLGSRLSRYTLLVEIPAVVREFAADPAACGSCRAARSVGWLCGIRPGGCGPDRRSGNSGPHQGNLALAGRILR